MTAIPSSEEKIAAFRIARTILPCGKQAVFKCLKVSQSVSERHRDRKFLSMTRVAKCRSVTQHFRAAVSIGGNVANHNSCICCSSYRNSYFLRKIRVRKESP